MDILYLMILCLLDDEIKEEEKDVKVKNDTKKEEKS